MPRRFWVLVGWVIALTTLATAASVVQHTYSDLQRIGECEVPNLADREACADQRLIEGAAKMAATVARVPAFGLAAIATAIGFASYRNRPRPAPQPPAVDNARRGTHQAPGAPDPAADAMPAEAAEVPAPDKGTDATEGRDAPIRRSTHGPATQRRASDPSPRARRRSKTPSTTLDEAGTA